MISLVYEGLLIAGFLYLVGCLGYALCAWARRIGQGSSHVVTEAPTPSIRPNGVPFAHGSPKGRKQLRRLARRVAEARRFLEQQR